MDSGMSLAQALRICSRQSSWRLGGSSEPSAWQKLEAPPNGLGLSGGAPIDWESVRANLGSQNRHDLVGAECRPLQPPMRHAVCQYGRNA
jgi:hypothetical protein